MLTLKYGSVFTDRWRDLDLEVVKADWARELGRTPAASLKWAMENLPSQPPHIGDFKRLCNQAPQEFVAIHGNLHTRGPTEIELAKIRALKSMPFVSIGNREWAYRLIDRHESGEWRSTPAALKMAHDALGHGLIDQSEAAS